MGVTDWNDPSTSIIATGDHHNGPWQVADPRVTASDHRHSSGLGVNEWAEPSHTVVGAGRVRSAWYSVADPRIPEIVGPPIDLESKRPCHLVIMAADGTWHRPMTTLELAALQGLPVRHGDGWLTLPGNDQQRRRLIGDCVPPPAAEAIARACATALAEAGAFRLSSEDIWVAPVVLPAAEGTR